MVRTVIIAEAGVNHNGSLDFAKKLIVEAAKAGADYVKFQTFKTELVVNKNAPRAEYQKSNMPGGGSTQYEMLQKLEIPEYWYPELLKCCEDHDICFLSTGFDEVSIDFLDTLNPPLYKIPSGEITNKPYLQHVARKGRPILISTGMANLAEITEAVSILLHEGIDKDHITALHCNTEYPTPMKDVNLLAMLHIQRELGVKVGYSDHTLGTEVPIAAVAIGARVIEKHFTLDRMLPGPDHLASLVPTELEYMVRAIRNIELALSGDGIKRPSPSEQKNLAIARKSLHYRKDLKASKIITKEDVIALRPGTGISPMEIDNILGKTLITNVIAGQAISYKDIQ